MVIRADPDIDPKMVFHLGADGQLSPALDPRQPLSGFPEPQVIPQTSP
jgi:hypothetical protein